MTWIDLDLFYGKVIFVAPALARCEIGVGFSVRPSVFPSTIYVDPSI